ncbi:alkene reductase [Spirillospora sp. CA-255316]
MLVGPYLLRNRVVMPPLTRNRADRGDMPTDLMALYYAQRAGAGLLIVEGSPISREAVAYPGTPGIYNAEQVAAWRRVTDAVHARGGVIFLQLWHVGRQSHSSTQPGGALPVAPSAVRIDSEIFTRNGPQPFETPRALELHEIEGIVETYADAARNALRAGFDGVEIHAANGYLLDQFLNDQVNLRTDAYGGPVGHRMRLLLEVTDAVSSVWGPERVGVRLSPSSTWMECRDSDPKHLYSEVVTALAPRGLAYLHLVEPTIAGSETVEAAEDAIPTAHFRSLYPGTIIVAGDHTPESGAQAVLSGGADLVAYGRSFISNPDLPARLAAGAPLRPADRSRFYGGGEKGYTDYPSLVDEERLRLVEEALDSGALSRDRLQAALSQRSPLSLLDSGDYYVRLKLAE